jgi:outer membrane protein insertion porin family
MARLVLPLMCAALGLGLSGPAPAAPRPDWEAPEGADEETESVERDEGERPAAILEAIEVIGNAKTTEDTILKRVSVAIGAPIDDGRIEVSRLRLLATGWFRTVEFSLRRGSSRGRAVLVIELEERNTLVVDDVFVGYSRVAPFFAGLGLHESNFLGAGVSAGAGFVLGRDRRAFQLELFVPELSGTALSLGASAIFVQAAEAIDPDDPDAVELGYSRVGGSLGLALGVGLAQRVVLDYRLESIQADPLPNLDPARLRAAPSILFDASVLSTLALTYEFDTRDDAFVPSRGARVALSVETGTRLIGSSYEFTKYTADVQLAFAPVLGHALSLTAFGGVVQGQTPFFNQFFLMDHAYFAWGRDALPRAIETNFSESNDYDDLVVSVGADYSVPLSAGEGFLQRSFVYAGVDASATASLDERQEDGTGRGTGGAFPVSFDLGLRLDTLVGRFTISLSYGLELVL